MSNRHRSVRFWIALVAGLLIATGAVAAQPSSDELSKRNEYLSTHGNSSCSQSFMTSIPAMPAVGRLKGSCCSPMTLDRYTTQIKGLQKYKDVAEIPSDPYDIEAGLAQAALTSYDLPLSSSEQQAYDFAMQHSEEKGPCCCKCWRWHVYGGLAKLLIRKHGFTGEQITEIWNLSDGCGGDA